MPQASGVRASPRLVAWAMSRGIRLRLSSAERGFAPPAWVKQSRNPVRRSSSMNTEAIGANGTSAVNSSLSSPAFGRDVLRRQPRDHQVAIVVQPNRARPVGQHLIHFAQGLIPVGLLPAE